MKRLSIHLSDEERTALQAMADEERRDPRVQAALLVRLGLEQTGLLQPLRGTWKGKPVGAEIDQAQTEKPGSVEILGSGHRES